MANKKKVQERADKTQISGLFSAFHDEYAIGRLSEHDKDEKIETDKIAVYISSDEEEEIG